MTLTYNIPLILADEDGLYWENLLTESAKAYDACARYIRVNNIPLNVKSVHDEVYSWMRMDYPTIPAQGVVRIYKDVLAAIRSMKSNRAGNAVPEKKGLSMRLDKRLYSALDKTGISLTGARKGKRSRATFVLFPKAEEMFDKYKPADPLIFLRDGKFYLSVPFIVPDVEAKGDSCVGVDLGMKRLFVTSDGYYFKDKAYAGARRRLRYQKRCLQSKGTKSAKRKLKQISRKESNMSKDMCYRAAKALIDSTEATVIAMEDLTKIKKNTSKDKEGHKRKRHNNAISQVPFYKFRQILTYKALLAGKRVETVNPANTSQANSRSGKIDGTRKGCRYYCPDGIVLDADWNASINIGHRSKHPVSSAPPVDGGLRPLSGRRQSTRQSWTGSMPACKPLNL